MRYFIDQTSGLLTGSDAFISSPNCDERPANTEISLLVIHNISLPAGEFHGPYITALFTNTLDTQAYPGFQSLIGLKVSSHLLIRRTGEVIQYVPFNKRAWHAGVSFFKNRENCNDFSIGIELEGTDTQPYEQIQYQKLAVLTSVICQAYPAITLDQIVGHNDIAPTRKTDPGVAFDWDYYRNLLKK